MAVAIFFNYWEYLITKFKEFYITSIWLSDSSSTFVVYYSELCIVTLLKMLQWPEHMNIPYEKIGILDWNFELDTNQFISRVCIKFIWPKWNQVRKTWVYDMKFLFEWCKLFFVRQLPEIIVKYIFVNEILYCWIWKIMKSRRYRLT